MQTIDTGVPDVTVATISGRLDSALAPAVEGWLLGLVTDAHVVLDMADIRFVSSAGLRVLLKAGKAAKSSGKNFVCCCMQPDVNEVYQISGFDRIIPVHATREAAVAALG